MLSDLISAVAAPLQRFEVELDKVARARREVSSASDGTFSLGCDKVEEADREVLAPIGEVKLVDEQLERWCRNFSARFARLGSLQALELCMG